MFPFLKKSKGDIYGGVTAGIVALPLALAFGVQSGLGAIYGLYGAIILGFIASVFGGTKTQISGPTGPMTVVTASVVMTAATVVDESDVLAVVIAAFLLAGIFQILMGFSGIGKYIRYIPYPVLSGFMSGIGVIIILLQIFPLVGLQSPANTIQVLKELMQFNLHVDSSTLILGALTIGIIYIVPKYFKSIPSPLIALVVCTAINYFFPLGAETIGDVPVGLPAFTAGDVLSIPMSALIIVVEFALILAALGAIDTLLTSVVADNITQTKHNSNRELVGQGVGNFVSGLFMGIPGAGATMRTVVNINSGGRTQVSGLIHSVLLAGLLLGAAPLASIIPLSVLAGILITVGIGIIDYKGLRQLFYIPKSDAAVMMTVLLMTVFVNLLQAVLVGVILACVLSIKRISDMAEEQSQFKSLHEWDKQHAVPADIVLPENMRAEIIIKQIKSPLFFGYAPGFREFFDSLDGQVNYIIFQMEEVAFIDQSGAYALEEVLKTLRDRKINYLVSGLDSEKASLLQNLILTPGLLNPQNMMNNMQQCLIFLSNQCQSIKPLKQVVNG